MCRQAKTPHYWQELGNSGGCALPALSDLLANAGASLHELDRLSAAGSKARVRRRLLVAEARELPQRKVEAIAQLDRHLVSLGKRARVENPYA